MGETKTIKKTLEYWENHITQWQASKLKMAAYCRQAELNIHQFKYWRYRLAPSTHHTQVKSIKPKEKLFSPVILESSSNQMQPNGKAKPSNFEFIINSKLTLKVPQQFQVDSLKQLLQLLEVL